MGPLDGKIFGVQKQMVWTRNGKRRRKRELEPDLKILMVSPVYFLRVEIGGLR